MNSIEEKRNKTVHEIQFDKYLQETKDQIEQINKGIEVKNILVKILIVIIHMIKNIILMK